MDPTVIITIIFLLLMLIATLVSVFIESRKHIKRLEGRIERLSNRLQAMNMKDLDTVLKSLKYKQERDELGEILENIDSALEALEDGRQIKIVPKLPRTYLDKSNYLKTYKSYYTYNPSHNTPSQEDRQTNSSENTSSQDSSSYSGGGGDFSGGGSGGSWD